MIIPADVKGGFGTAAVGDESSVVGSPVEMKKVIII